MKFFFAMASVLVASALLGTAWGLEIVTQELPVAIVHQPYTPEPLFISGPSRCLVSDVSVRVVFGHLPPGITLSGAGYFRGRPTEVGVYTFLVRAADTCEVTTRTLTLRVDGAPLLEVLPGALEFTYRMGDPLPPAQQIVVSGSWNDMPYAVEAEGADWVQLRPLRGRTPIEGTGFRGDPVAVSINPSKLKPGLYRTWIKITAWRTVNEPLIPVTLRITSAP